RLKFDRLQLDRIRVKFHWIELEFHRLEFQQFQQFRRLQLWLLAVLELGWQPGRLRRLVMTPSAVDAVPQTPAGASWRALGTFVHLLVTEPAHLGEARQLLVEDLADVDAACSRFRPDSEICSLGGGRATEISPLLAEAIAVALRAARLTEGDVDPTVGAAMSAIGYDRDFECVKGVGPAIKLTVREVPGWRQI